MARARNIKPGFFKNEILAELDPLARILFEGLWCLADREGRLEDRPKRIKSDILPYDDCDVDGFLWDLHNKNFIIRYEVQGSKYIQIVTFKKHQNPHCKEAPSEIPAPDLHHASTVQEPDKNRTSPADSLNLDPDSLNLDPLPPNPPQGEPEKKQTPFDIFWEAYPKKRSKGDAEKAWKKIKPNEQLLTAILSKLEQAKTSVEWTKDGGQFIPYPASWLNAKGWEDEYTPVGLNHGRADPGKVYPLPRAFESIRQFAEEGDSS